MANMTWTFLYLFSVSFHALIFEHQPSFNKKEPHASSRSLWGFLMKYFKAAFSEQVDCFYYSFYIVQNTFCGYL